MIATRLEAVQQRVGTKTQVEFRTDHRCPDAVGPLNAALPALIESDQEADLLLIDSVKAVDTINCEILWHSRQIYGLPDNLIVVIKELYSGKAIGFFESTLGRQQGDPVRQLLRPCARLDHTERPFSASTESLRS